MRLYWAGHYDCGGVLVAAPDRRTALRRAHDEICTCDERAECLRDGEWTAYTVESALRGHVQGRARIRLVHGGTHSADWRLWWGASEEDGDFVIARSKAEALALMSREYEGVTCIDEVDGYTVIVEIVGRCGPTLSC